MAVQIAVKKVGEKVLKTVAKAIAKNTAKKAGEKATKTAIEKVAEKLTGLTKAEITKEAGKEAIDTAYRTARRNLLAQARRYLKEGMTSEEIGVKIPKIPKKATAGSIEKIIKLSKRMSETYRKWKSDQEESDDPIDKGKFIYDQIMKIIDPVKGILKEKRRRAIESDEDTTKPNITISNHSPFDHYFRTDHGYAKAVDMAGQIYISMVLAAAKWGESEVGNVLEDELTNAQLTIERLVYYMYDKEYQDDDSSADSILQNIKNTLLVMI